MRRFKFLLSSVAKDQRKPKEFYQPKIKNLKDGLLYMDNLKKQKIEILPNLYIKLLSFCKEDGDLKNGKKIFEEMEKKGYLNEISYNIMLWLYSKSFNVSDCLNLFDEMIKKKINPTSATLDIIYTNIDIATIDKIEEKIAPLNIVKDGRLIRKLMQINVKNKRVDKALEILKNTKEKDIKYFYPFFMGSSLPEYYYKIIHQYMKESNIEPDEFIIRNSILKVHWISFSLYQKFKGKFTPDLTFFIELSKNPEMDYEKAIFIFKEMTSLNIPIDPKILNCILMSLGDKKLTKQVYNVFLESKNYNVPLNNFVYATLIRHTSYVDIELAEELFADMVSSGIEPNEISYNELIIALSRNKKGHKIVFYYQQMKSSNFKINLDIYTSILTGLSNLHLHESAMLVFSDMIQNNIFPSVHTLTLLLKSLLLHQKENEVKELFNTILSRFKLDQHLYEFLIIWFYANKDIQKVHSLLNEMKEKKMSYTKRILLIVKEIE